MSFSVTTHGGDVRIEHGDSPHLVFRREDLVAFHVTSDNRLWSIDWVFRSGAFRTQYSTREDCESISRPMVNAFFGSGY